MASALDSLRAAYIDVCEKIAEMMANPRPSYSVDGVSLDYDAYYASLFASEEALRGIPGVAVGINSPFTVLG